MASDLRHPSQKETGEQVVCIKRTEGEACFLGKVFVENRHLKSIVDGSQVAIALQYRPPRAGGMALRMVTAELQRNRVRKIRTLWTDGYLKPCRRCGGALAAIDDGKTGTLTTPTRRKTHAPSGHDLAQGHAGGCA